MYIIEYSGILQSKSRSVRNVVTYRNNTADRLETEATRHFHMALSTAHGKEPRV
jgi:hypothetical protein